MASTTQAARLTEAHRLAQSRIGAYTVKLLRSSWRLLDPSALDATIEGWLRVNVPLVQRQRAKSARLAGEYVRAFRTLEVGFDAGYVPVLDLVGDAEQIATSLTVTGPVQIKEQMRKMRPFVYALRQAEASMAGAGMRHALNGGRETVIRSGRADKKALGYARVVSGDPCYFCAMLASRGPVYFSAETAGFEPHDTCKCAAELVYSTDSAWPPGGEKYRDMWAEAKELDGDIKSNFRQLVEAEKTVAPLVGT